MLRTHYVAVTATKICAVPVEKDVNGCPLLRSKEDCEAIAKSMADLAARKGWRLSYSVVEAPVMPEEFFTSYVTCALWSSTDNSRDDGGDPLDDNYDADDVAPLARAAMRRDCEAFYAANAADIEAGRVEPYRGEWLHAEIAGHDFWLTRNGHGCGFWDGDWPEPAATRLTDASKAFGSDDLYVGDDGKIHASSEYVPASASAEAGAS